MYVSQAHTVREVMNVLHLDKVTIPAEIKTALENGAHLVLSDSGGKDSEAMSRVLLALHAQNGWTGEIHIVHADLGRAEWSITMQYIEDCAKRFALPLHVVRHSFGDLVDGIKRRWAKRQDSPPWPSSAARWCTSDWKRSVIDRWIRNQFPADAVVICAMGLRAEESPARAKRPVFEIRENATAVTKNRIVYDWNPIHNFILADVWDILGYNLDELHTLQAAYKVAREAKDQATMGAMVADFKAHPAYLMGNERLSCAMCILASMNDLLNGAANHPDLYRELVDIEIETGFSFRQNLWLGDLLPELLAPQQRVAIEIVKARAVVTNEARKAAKKALAVTDCSDMV